MRNTKGTGALGEKIASEFLQRKGYAIIEMNFRRPWGEIDIIAVKGNIVRFVEVKAITGRIGDISREIEQYRPEEQIHATKLRKIVRTAELYMHGRNDKREFQIDAVGVILDPGQRKARCRLFEQIL